MILSETTGNSTTLNAKPMKNAIKFSATGREDWMKTANVPLEIARLIEGKALKQDHIYYRREPPGIRSSI